MMSHACRFLLLLCLTAPDVVAQECVEYAEVSDVVVIPGLGPATQLARSEELLFSVSEGAEGDVLSVFAVDAEGLLEPLDSLVIGGRYSRLVVGARSGPFRLCSPFSPFPHPQSGQSSRPTLSCRRKRTRFQGARL